MNSQSQMTFQAHPTLLNHSNLSGSNQFLKHKFSLKRVNLLNLEYFFFFLISQKAMRIISGEVESQYSKSG